MNETLEGLPVAEEAAENAPEVEVVEAEQPEQEPLIAELAEAENRHRRDWAARIRTEQRLPAALREQLASSVEAHATLVGDSEPTLTISQVANVLAESVPTLLALAGPATAAVHPAGEGFFQNGQLSDHDAARVAAEQLARTGFGR